MGLLTLLTEPKNFKFYTGKGYSGDGNTIGLKSLRYGNDRLGGANSGQPYIQVGIPDDISSYIGTTDYINRGGINVVRDSLVDVERLGKMFADTRSPNGIFFISKQNLLSRTAVKTQTSGRLLNEGIYSPLSTLAQAGVVAFGGHLNKQGLNPFASTGAYSNNDNLYGVKIKNDQPTDENRLVNLFNSIVKDDPISKFGGTRGTTLNPGGNNGGILITYSGGPGSTLGVGSTDIRKAKTFYDVSLASPKNNYSYSQNTWVFNSNLLLTPYVYETLPPVVTTNASDTTEGSLASPKIQDFRALLRTKLQGEELTKAKQSGAVAEAPSYNSKNVDLRTNQGQPGQRANKSYYDYSKGVISTATNTSYYGTGSIGDLGSYKRGLDKINSLPIYRSEVASTDSELNDLVNFRIAVIDNDSPSFKTFLHFRAFLGSVQDSYNAQWNGFNYLGRGEQFYTYGGFTRQMSLSWTIAAQSKEELMPMYRKLNYLASTLTPNYSDNYGFMRGNLVQLTIGGYVYEQPGFITSLSFDIQEDTPWEIGINTQGNTDTSVKQLPHIIRVSGFSFTPIQRFLPEKQRLTFVNTGGTSSLDTSDDTGFVNNYGAQRYISLQDSDTSGYNTSFEQAAAQETTPEEIQQTIYQVNNYPGGPN